MNESLAAKWAVIRSRGRARYIWLHGVVLWGWPTAILWSLATCALQGWDRLPQFLPIALISFSLAGVLAGTWGWARHERNFAQRMSTHTPAHVPQP